MNINTQAWISPLKSNLFFHAIRPKKNYYFTMEKSCKFIGQSCGNPVNYKIIIKFSLFLCRSDFFVLLTFGGSGKGSHDDHC